MDGKILARCENTHTLFADPLIRIHLSIMGAITESDDNALENYFIGLALAKSSIVESIDSAIASIG